jgi:DNA (cytosine-5)-methyltransferase 1
MNQIVTGKNGIFSFFSGCGILDLGFEENGFEILFVNEFNPEFMIAYKHSRKILKKKAPIFSYSEESIDVFLSLTNKNKLISNIKNAKNEFSTIGFIGGPPCPDFSVAGKNKGHTGENGRLSQSYIDLIISIKPDWFLFENVRGLWKTKKHREFYDNLKNQLEIAGYELSDKLLNSLEFGAPQDRERVFLFGTLKKLKLNTPEKFNFLKYKKFDINEIKNSEWPEKTKFGSDYFGVKNLPNLSVQYWFDKNSVDSHPNSKNAFTARAGLAKFLIIEEGDVSRKSYKRLHRYRYSPTVAYGNNEVHLHPTKPRRLTVSEALSLQSLPKRFELPQTMTLSSMFKTIGNGVPFLMASGIAQSISNHLSRPTND